MTQPAKVQEPSMEEILASIRRIIADDEATPPSGEKPSSPTVQARPEKAAAASARVPAINGGSPPASAAERPAAAKPAAAPIKAAPPPPPPPPAAASTNNQDDIDSLLAGLDEATSPEEIRPPASEPEVFELTDDMAVPTAKPAFHRVEPRDDLVFVESHTARAVQRQDAFEARVESNPDPAPPILSRSTVSAVESAFNTLAHTVLSNNARTLEDLVKEMLRPMLKSWLDDNLPGLVERIVKAEIERVSRGR